MLSFQKKGLPSASSSSSSSLYPDAWGNAMHCNEEHLYEINQRHISELSLLITHYQENIKYQLIYRLR